MNKDLLRDLKPIIDFVYELLDETEQKDDELSEVRNIARRLSDDLNKAVQEIQQLKNENHAMKAFIEAEVPEEKQKLIFK